MPSFTEGRRTKSAMERNRLQERNVGEGEMSAGGSRTKKKKSKLELSLQDP